MCIRQAREGTGLRMSVNLIFKIAAVGILVTVISQVLKHSGREEHAFLTSLAGLLIVLFWIVPYIYELFETMQSLFGIIRCYRMGMRHEMDILRIAVLGIAGVLLALLLQKEKSEYSMFISMAVCICIFIYIIGKVETVINFAKKMQTFVAVDQTYITLILKMVGITYVAEFAMNICKDAGYAAVGNQIELFAKLSILVLSIPVLTVFLETVGSFL